MDWGRAKTILIVSFLFLNVLLGYQLWSSRWDSTDTLGGSKGIADETNALLGLKRIRVLTDVPKEAPKLKQITVRFPEKYRNAPNMELTPPVKYLGLFHKNLLKDIVAKTPIDKGDSYQLDTAASREGLVVYNQTIDGLPMFDVTLLLYEQKGEITGYKQAYVEVQSGGEQKEQPVISAYTAIRSLAESYLTEGSVITDIKLGYHGQQYDSETQYLLPFWRIMLSQGEPYFVQAFNGEVEDPLAKQRKESEFGGLMP